MYICIYTYTYDVECAVSAWFTHPHTPAYTTHTHTHTRTNLLTKGCYAHMELIYKHSLSDTHTHRTHTNHFFHNRQLHTSRTHRRRLRASLAIFHRYVCACVYIYRYLGGIERGGGRTFVLSCSDRFVAGKYVYTCTSTCCDFFFFKDNKLRLHIYGNDSYVCMSLCRDHVEFFFLNRHICFSVSLSLRLFLSLSVCLPFSFPFSTLSLSSLPPLSPYLFTLSLSHTLFLLLYYLLLY